MSKNTVIQTPLGFGGTSISLDPLGFAPSGVVAAPAVTRKLYLGSTQLTNLKVTDGSGTVKTITQIYYGSTLVWG